MLIKKIILSKYRRLSLNSIERLEYTPENNIQVIIGRNMSGKSSLLKELTPLPADLKKEFKDTGYKEIHIEHGNSNYCLINSINNGKVTNNFIKDNVELNEGGTRKVQLELVKQYFNITPNIMDILLNKNNFTTMSPFERKQWFSEMSSIDYTYPISVYNKIKSRHRDIVGGIKLAGDNIVNTESKLNNSEYIDKRIEDKKILEEIKDHISSLYVSIDPTTEEQLNKLSNDINYLEGLTSVLDTKYNIDNIKSNLDKNKVRLEHTLEEIKKINKEMDIIETSSKIEGEEELRKEELSLKTKIESIDKEIDNTIKSDYIDKTKLDKQYESFINTYTSLLPFINALTEYDKYISIDKEKEDNLRSLKNRLEESIVKDTNSIKLLNQEKETMINSKVDKNKVTCDSCGNTWYLNYNESRLKEIDKSIELLDKQLVESNKKYTSCNSVLESIELRNKYKDIILNTLRSNMYLKHIWDSVLNEVDIYTSVSEKILTVFNKYNLLLSNWSSKTGYEIKYEEIVSKLKFIEETKKMNVSLEKTRLESLNKKLYEYQSLSKDLSRSINTDTNILKVLEKISNGYSSLKRSIVNYKSNLNKLTIEIRNKYLTELNNSIREDIMNVEKDIFEFKSGKDRIEKEKVLLDNYKVKEKVLRLLEKELSPSEGLIAKSINSFLNIFVEEMNEVISNVWTYDLELLPCDIDSDSGYDLDYKFKVKINNNEVVDDVNKLSSSAKEIVNLAYRIVFAKYMGLEDIPLYLDEFGSSFDPTHRSKAYDVIDKIMSSEYNQIYMVCHYETLYSTIRNIDVNILDPNNIETNYIQDKNTRFKIN